MEGKKKVRTIQNHYFLLKLKLNVAVYCRVSTSHPGQLESLANQINYYKTMVNNRLD